MARGRRDRYVVGVAGESTGFNEQLPERFTQRPQIAQKARLQGESSNSGATLVPYANRLQAYYSSSTMRDDSKHWTSTTELPMVGEIIDMNDNNGDAINRLDETIVNIVDKAWPSRAQYLEHQYKLLREDALRPLRAAVGTVLKNLEARELAMSSIGIYDNVHFSGVTLSNRGIGLRVSFSLRRVGKQIKWNQSKRLTTGSLVVLLPADTRSCDPIKVAVVASRALSIVDKELPEVDLFLAQAQDLEIDNQKKWIMVEDRGGFFEAERHTLLALQKMMQESFPLSEYLVELKKSTKPPNFVTKSPSMDLRSVFPLLSRRSISRNVLTDWPTQQPDLMDNSQAAALKQILTSSLALVQGPPGTGKTFVSTQAIDIMLTNMSDGDAPIVIACQTNHALDQILCQVAAKWPACFVRLGSRSKDREIIQKRTLFELRQGMKVPQSGRRGFGRKRIRNLTKQIQELLKPFEKGARVLTLEYLEHMGVLNTSQCNSIRACARKWQSAGNATTEQNDLQKWAGAEIKPVVLQTAPCLFPEVEETELDMEELNEVEAENAAATDEEEFDLLAGEFIQLGDDWVGNANISAKATGSIDQMINETQDMGKINPKLRGAIYNHLVRCAKDLTVAKFREVAKQYAEAVREHMIGKREEDAFVLGQFKIIGVTTTGFSKYRSLIDAVQPKVVLIEEAAETLEAPITATCINSLEQLILVGDHKQLRPHCHSRELEDEPVNLNISMFERLVRNGVDFSLLTRQRRMIPGVRRLLQPLYGDAIEDHPLVKDKTQRPPVPGMGKKSVWFYSHAGQEAKDNQLSFYNQTEAAMIVEFIRYLLYNTVAPKDITILTFYNGQKRKIMAFLRKRLGEPGKVIQVVTVDSYQGEENGIILLSLVRNNTQGSIGFLAVENRVCVALSRAQRGLYIFGNGELLCGESKIWCDIIKILRGVNPNDRRRIGFTVPLQCEKHKRKIWIATLQDWEQNAGGCEMGCEEPMSCGHVCAELCHDSVHHDCKRTCGRTLPCSHSCKEKCVDPCRCRQCENNTKIGSRGRSENQTDSSQPGSSRRDSALSRSSQRNPDSRSSSQHSKAAAAWNDFANGDVIQHDENIRRLREDNRSRESRRILDQINEEMLFGSNSLCVGLNHKAEELMAMAEGKVVHRATFQGQAVDDILNLHPENCQRSLLD